MPTTKAKAPSKARQIGHHRQIVIDAALDYTSLLHRTMVNPALRQQWNNSHGHLLAVTAQLQELLKPTVLPEQADADD